MILSKKRLVIFASGTSTGGGSGFQWLVEATESGILNASIVAVVSNFETGGVSRIAHELNIPFMYSPKGRSEQAYRDIMIKTQADFAACSGWLGIVTGLSEVSSQDDPMNPGRWINIHPGDKDRFGGKGMHGLNVHKRVIDEYLRGSLTHTAVTMHYVTSGIDQGPEIFFYPIKVRRSDTPESLGARVNEVEHAFQAFVTNLVITGAISWNGNVHSDVIFPQWYSWKRECFPNYSPYFDDKVAF